MRGVVDLQTPSGRKFDDFDLEVLRTMHDCGFVRHSPQPFTLKSGINSNVYVFGREDLTDNPNLEIKIGSKIARQVANATLPGEKQICLVGIPTAGTALAQAAAMMSYRITTMSICHRIMREAVKTTHGASAHQGSWINGKPDLIRHSYWLVDNVAKNGQSKLEAIAKFKADGYPGPEDTPCLIWIDRQQGAVPRLEKAGFKRIIVVYNLLDITFAFGEMGLWPKEAVKAVEQEIAAHQFLPQD
ncbi:MAG: hypothetical protein U1C57_01045 [Candidatus Doudnabacteria bacterium]|nr:hypothetical protein [Candidatus Doudnabacteria bacterium]